MEVTPAGRLSLFWRRHRNLFWWLHSVWAFATGVAVLVLARERYGFVPWVVLFLALTWASTLVFGNRTGASADPDEIPGFGTEVTSWLTRGMFQETLFFLLPFYFYSTVIRSPNVVFPLLLAGLALFSCADVVFDRWLRSRPVFGMLFFASVAFAALNLLLPILMGIDPAIATPVAGVLAVASSAPIAVRAARREARRELVAAGLGGAVVIAVTILAQVLIPPVPLRMVAATFASDIDAETLQLADSLGARATVDETGDRFVVLAEVFAPSELPTRVRMEWYLDGTPIRTSRTVEILAHDAGFRIWDAWSPEVGSPAPGRYEVVLRTSGGRIFGRTGITLTSGRPQSSGSFAPPPAPSPSARFATSTIS